MPKHGFLTPKAVANRQKSKGLQKLRWYCQMCGKQCRDENGFRCHTMSESHQRQLLLFAVNQKKFTDQFSQEFLEDFVHLLQRRYGTKRVNANLVYQEYISDRNHLHMNATQWETLTEFVKWMGREGHCIADETEQGWFISYIDRDPETIRRQESAMKSEKRKLDDEERMAKFFRRQMDKDKSRPLPDSVYTVLQKENDEQKVAFAFKQTLRLDKPSVDPKQNPLLALISKSAIKKSKDGKRDDKKRKLALKEIMEQEQRARTKKSRKDY